MNRKTELLKAALHAFNEIPNKRITHPSFTHTYDIAAAISKELKDTDQGDKEVSFSWCTEDVIENGRQNEKEITEEQAIEILALVKKNHDCTIGVNWDVIDVWTDYYFDELKK